jgi:hypothetical protein
MGTLGSGYVAAASEAQRAADVAAAELGTGATDAGLTLANVLIYGFTLLISIAMRTGVFGKGAAYLVPALSMLTLLAAIGWAVWFFVVGFRLYRLG